MAKKYDDLEDGDEAEQPEGTQPLSWRLDGKAEDQDDELPPKTVVPFEEDFELADAAEPPPQSHSEPPQSRVMDETMVPESHSQTTIGSMKVKDAPHTQALSEIVAGIEQKKSVFSFLSNSFVQLALAILIGAVIAYFYKLRQ